MTPQCWNCSVREALQRCQFLDNGSLKHVSAATDKLGLQVASHFNEYAGNNRRTVRRGELYSDRPEVLKGEAGVEYLHRSPASGRRRRKGKSRI
jgi:hypothetical protein